MKRMRGALVWATVILATALASSLEAISDNTATTLLVVLPLVALMSISGRVTCRPAGWA